MPHPHTKRPSKHKNQPSNTQKTKNNQNNQSNSKKANKDPTTHQTQITKTQKRKNQIAHAKNKPNPFIPTYRYYKTLMRTTQKRTHLNRKKDQAQKHISPTSPRPRANNKKTNPIQPNETHKNESQGKQRAKTDPSTHAKALTLL